MGVLGAASQGPLAMLAEKIIRIKARRSRRHANYDIKHIVTIMTSVTEVVWSVLYDIANIA